MASLQEQLLKAGLTTKQKARQANSDQRKKISKNVVASGMMRHYKSKLNKTWQKLKLKNKKKITR
nr:DUF2058 family protein [Colwellia maritima]